MKRTIVLIMLIIIYSCIWSQEFEINKISEIAYAQGNAVADCIQIIDSYLYYMSHNGLEIYEINGDGSITKLSTLAIAKPRSMVIEGQYCFISSGDNFNLNIIPEYYVKINKIDINDVQNPIIVDQLEYSELYEHMGIFKLGSYMLLYWFIGGLVYYDIYNIPDMDYIGQVVTDNYYLPINDSILVKQDGYILTTVQYNPPNEFEIIGTTDVSAYSDGNYTYMHYKVLNDTILSAVNYKNITFWDISDVTNWQYVSRYTLPEGVGMRGNKQYSIMDDNVVIFTSSSLLRLLDISDISNPIEVDSLTNITYYWGRGCDNYISNLYVGTVTDGIQHYVIENNTIEYNDSYFDHIRFFIGNLYDNKIITSTIMEGYYLFDIEDPLNAIDLGEWFSEKYFRLIHKQGGWMVLKDHADLQFEVYDITDLENPFLRNTLSLGNQSNFIETVCIIDEFDSNNIYLVNFITNIFRKFDISEPGEAVELFEYELPSTYQNLTVINSVCYVTYGTSPYELQVISGLDENEPFIANEISNFTENMYLANQNGYLLTRGSEISGDIAQVFQLDNPLQPELYFTPQWGGTINIHDNLIFTLQDYIIGVYENKPNSTEPIAIFNGLNYIYNINIIEHDCTNYLITNEMANIGLFEYTYVPSSVEDKLPKPEITLSNYPNPFNPLTSIVFNLPVEGEVQLDIYNIKGQKVKTFNAFPNRGLGTRSIVWDGTDEDNKPVSSGIYMFQLKVDGKAIASKKCLLLK